MASSGTFKFLATGPQGIVCGQQLLGAPITYSPGSFTNLNASTTLTPNQTIGGNIYITTGSDGATLTLPGADAIYAACNKTANVNFTFTLFSGYTLTLKGSGWTMYGASSVGSNTIVSQGKNTVSLLSNCSHTFTCVVNGANDVRAAYSS